MYRRSCPDESCASAGFTLIEVLVALAVVAIGLPVVGSLLAANIRGTVKVEQRTRLLSTYRGLEASLLERVNLVSGTRSGEVEGTRWTIEVRPMREDEIGPSKPGAFVPRAVVTTLRSPSGETLRVETIRLGQRGSG